MYSIFSAFWMLVFGVKAIWDTSTIGMDGFHYFSRIDLLSARWLLWTILLLACGVLTVVAIFKKQPMPTLNIVLTVWNGVHIATFYLIPPQAYHTFLYITCRSFIDALHMSLNLMPIVSHITHYGFTACLVISMVILIIRTIRGNSHEEILSRGL